MGVLSEAALSCRELGQERLAQIAQCRTAEDYQRLWAEPKHEFPFAWGTCWKHTVEYRVDDFAAEAGFFIDLLGFYTNAFGPDYCMVMGPEHEFYLSFRPPAEGEASTPPAAISLQFMVADIVAVGAELERRGIALTQPVQPYGSPDHPMRTCKFVTPHGVEIMLWGMVEPSE